MLVASVHRRSYGSNEIKSGEAHYYRLLRLVIVEQIKAFTVETSCICF